MKKAIITIIASAFSAIALVTTSFATGNGIVGGVVQGAENIAEGVVEGAGDVVEGAGNTAENLLTPVTDNPTVDDAVNDNVTNQNVVANTAPVNPRTGVSAVPFAMTLGSIGVAAIAAAAGKRR